MSDELIHLDATAQAELVRRRTARPIELVDAAIARIERLNPQLNAVITESFDKARQQAKAVNLASEGARAERPFLGVPFLLKDLGGFSAGDPYHAGMRFLKERRWVETHDTYFAQRLKAAGFLVLGKTNTPELGLLPTTEPEAYGATHNPWDLDRSPGGSSGGAAAAVAARMVPAAHATDGGGSIRLPAAHCGLVGLKPSRGRVSMGPFSSEGWGGFSIGNTVTVSVRDTAAILDVLAGTMPGDPYTAPAPARPFREEVGADPGTLRIGVLLQTPSGVAVHADCIAATLAAARQLAALGHRVDEACPPEVLDPQMGRATAVVIGCSAARALDAWAERVGEPITAADVEAATWAFTDISRHLLGTDYLKALEYCHRKGRDLATWWESGFDLLLTPTSTLPPPPLGYVVDPGAPFETLARAASLSAFTSMFNATGQPAISLPLQRNEAGLPIGIHLVGAYGREDMLLRLAAQLEAAYPWAHDLPPIHA